MKYKYVVIFLFLLIFSIASASAENNEIWVSVDGNGTGYSSDSPTDMNTAMNNIKDDYVVNFYNGTYKTPEYLIKNRNVTLKAIVSGEVVFTGGNANDVFRVGGVAVTLSGFVFTQSYVNAYGGAVDWYGAYGTLENCKFVNNEALSGGALFWESNYGLVVNCTFEGNTAGGAGAIHWSGDDGKISNCTFKDNVATGSDGGAIHWSSKNGEIENCLFVGNTALGKVNGIGGAVYWSGLNGTISSNVFRNNKDKNGYQFYMSNTVTFKNNTFNSNRAIYNEGIVNDARMVVMDNETRYVLKDSNVSIWAVITDDNSNRICGGNMVFLFNGTRINVAPNFENADYATVISNVDCEGVVSGEYGSASNIKVSSGKISFNQIIGSDVVKYFRNDTNYEVHLLNSLGGSVLFTVNGQNYTRKLNDDGSAVFEINLPQGNYSIVARYMGLEVANSITALPTIVANDLVKYFLNESQFVVQALNPTGKPLADATLKFNINGQLYQRTTKNNGSAVFNINLPQGNYTITSEDSNGCVISNRVTVLPTIVENHDLKKYFKNSSEYSVKLLDGTGNSVNGGLVVFNVNGQFYKRLSNSEGIATLNINLPPQEYVVTADYNGCLVSNNITVLSIIESENIEMTVSSRIPFKAIVLDGVGNPLKEANLTFNVNGIIYNRTSDVNGSAELGIILPAGEYIITTFANDLYQSNTIIIREI